MNRYLHDVGIMLQGLAVGVTVGIVFLFVAFLFHKVTNFILDYDDDE